MTLLFTGPLSLNWLGLGSERIEAILREDMAQVETERWHAGYGEAHMYVDGRVSRALDDIKRVESVLRRSQCRGRANR